MAAKKTESQTVVYPFYQYLWWFYLDHKVEVRRSYTPLTKKILDYAKPESGTQSYLRVPQYEAFEMYVFLKEYLDNPRLADLLSDFISNQGKMHLADISNHTGSLFFAQDKDSFATMQEQLEKVRQQYANYIFALTMGTGKTILMALCICYEFLLAKKFPKDKRFCHNALVLAPDTTVLQSLKEIQTFDKSKIFQEQYAAELENCIRYHFLEDDGVSLPTADGSDYNIIISTSQKIILKKTHKQKSAQEELFTSTWETAVASSKNADLYELDDESQLNANQRYQKLTRLAQIGIYVDEGHHAFGKDLQRDMMDRTKETSLRLTIDNLAKELDSAGTSVVACYNFTGTPYVDNVLMPEVVYEYGLRPAIDKKYLKSAKVKDFEHVKSEEFIEESIKDFIGQHRNSDGSFKRYEGMLPKMAIFAATIDELTQELSPAVEKALSKFGISSDAILINVGDDKITKSDDLKEFLLLDTVKSQKQFILLVGKGKEGWNCRSLFSVALFREPKSKIFVLQATMRCLRSITDEQQEGRIYLSTANKLTLDDELNKNFRISLDEFTGSGAVQKPRRRIYVRTTEKIKVKREFIEYSLKEKKTGSYKLFNEKFSDEKYKKLVHEHSITNLTDSSKTTELSSPDERTFTPYSLIAEISLYLTQNKPDGTMLYSPPELKHLLEQSEEGIDGILKKVNATNDILYDWVIPELFKKIYDLEESRKEKEVEILLVKTPPKDKVDDSGNPFYEISADDDLYVSDSTNDATMPYSSYSQTTGNKKSFNVSGYGFDSRPERAFFDCNLFRNDDIKHIWFTGMFTAGQSDFLIHYIDPDSYALRSYYPDFLVETKEGSFFIIEIKGGNRVELPITKAKTEYATRLAKDSKMEYVFIPDTYAGMKLQEFINLKNKHEAQYSLDDEQQRLVAAEDKTAPTGNTEADKNVSYRIKH